MVFETTGGTVAVRPGCLANSKLAPKGGLMAAGGGCALDLNPCIGVVILAGLDCRLGPEALAAYARPRFGRSAFEILTSVVPYVAVSVLMYLALDVSLLLTLALILPAAGFLVRTFVVFHDCAHGSLLPSKLANRSVGRFLGLFVLSPFQRWRHDHAIHHATSGDLERRGVGDIITLTVGEYRARGWRGRLAYRLMRNPVVMFGFGPVIAMMIGPRIATRSQRPRLRHSVLGTDVALVVVIGGLCWLIGWQSFLIVWAPSAILAGSVGIWLFYVQHQFEDAYWQDPADWSYSEAALRGSSYLKLPKVLQFFTGNIGLHHVHHLNSRIPNYNLQRAHDENAIFRQVPTLSLWDGLRSVRLKLWDEEHGKLVTFAQAARTQPASVARHGSMPAQVAPEKVGASR
jgi:omega-6 fatty acid desaturase (delta-12 desaturase)